MIRILLADDQALVRDGLRTIVDREPDLEVVAEASDGVEAVSLARSERPDVALVDIRMPRLDGLAATRQLVLLDPAPRVVVLTTFDRDEWVYEALQAGASGFLLKDIRGERLVDAIRVTAAGEALLAPSLTRRLIERFASAGPVRSDPSGPIARLTPREREVLVLVAGGLSNTEIADRLVVEESTVKTHVHRLLTKLDLRDRAQAVVAAYEAGLVRRGG